MKILSWNIRQGGGTRIANICKGLTDYNAEIIVLSEYRNNHSGIQIRNLLLRAGYRYQNISAAQPNENSAAIFSKLPSNQKLFPNSDPTYGHNIVANQYEAFTVYGMYLPHKKKHVLFDFLVKESIKPTPSILVGDFNTGKNYIDQKGDSFWYTDKLLELEDNGCVDAFRHVHTDVREYSWYSHQGNGYRYDHTYVSNSILPVVKNCHYIHEWREEGLSDHSPMVLVLG